MLDDRCRGAKRTMLAAVDATQEWSLVASGCARRTSSICRLPRPSERRSRRLRALASYSDVSCRKTSLAYDSTRPTPPIESHKQTNTVARMPSKSNSRLRGFMRGKKRSTVKRFMTRQIPFVCLFCLFYS